jgi:hypothetical protein
MPAERDRMAVALEVQQRRLREEFADRVPAAPAARTIAQYSRLIQKNE